MPRGIPIQASAQASTQASTQAPKQKRALWHAVIPFAAIAFLLAQLLVGFHLHSDAELKRGDDHMPAAECTLCLAAHLPFDIADEFEFSAPDEFGAKRISPPAVDVHPAPTAPQHQPRAPPLTS